MTNLKGVDVRRLNRNQVDVEGGIRRDRDVLVEIERFKGRDQVGVGNGLIVKQRVTGKTVDLGEDASEIVRGTRIPQSAPRER